MSVFVVLRTTALEEQEIKRNIARLSISLEAQVIGQVLRQGDDQHVVQVKEVKESLGTELVDISGDPMICATEIQAEGEEDSTRYVYMFWKVQIHIGWYRGNV